MVAPSGNASRAMLIRCQPSPRTCAVESTRTTCCSSFVQQASICAVPFAPVRTHALNRTRSIHPWEYLTGKFTDPTPNQSPVAVILRLAFPSRTTVVSVLSFVAEIFRPIFPSRTTDESNWNAPARVPTSSESFSSLQ